MAYITLSCSAQPSLTTRLDHNIAGFEPRLPYVVDVMVRSATPVSGVVEEEGEEGQEGQEKQEEQEGHNGTSHLGEVRVSGDSNLEVDHEKEKRSNSL